MRTASLARSRSSRRTAWPASQPGVSASRTRSSGRSFPGRSALGGAGAQVREVEGVHPVADLRQALVALGIRLGQLTVLVVLGEDAGLVEHIVGDVDPRTDPHRDGNRVGRTR